jgi:hypothetical protein
MVETITFTHTFFLLAAFCFACARRRLMPRNVLYCFFGPAHLSLRLCRYYYYHYYYHL